MVNKGNFFISLCMVLISFGADAHLSINNDITPLDVRTEIGHGATMNDTDVKINYVKASDLNDDDAELYVFKKFGYGDMRYGFMKFQAQDPLNLTNIKAFSNTDGAESISAATYVNGEYWVYVYQSWWGGSLTIPVGIGVMDPMTGDYEIKYSTSAIHYYNEQFIEMTYDPLTNKVYGVQYIPELGSTDTRKMDLWVIDPTEGTYEPKKLGKVDAYMFGMAARGGVIYGITQDYTDNDLSKPEKARLIKFDPNISEDGVYVTTHVADIDDGNRVIRYDQTMEFDHATGRLWWAAQETANNGGYVCEVDITDGSLRHENRIPDASQYVAMTIPYQVVDAKAPSYVSHFSAISLQQSPMHIVLSWTNPTKSYDCNVLTDLSGVKIYRDQELMADISDVEVGETMSWTDENAALGSHTYRIVAYNNSGDGLWRERDAYAGVDVPGKVTNIKYDTKGEILTMTWDAPLVGKHKGWYDKESLSYDIYRGSYKVESSIVEGKFVDQVNYYDHFVYKIVPITNDGEGESTELTISFGPAYELPYINDLSDEEMIEELSIDDNNNDGHSWVYSSEDGAYVYTSHYENVADDYLFLPALRVEEGKTYRYTFEYITSNYTNAIEDFDVVLASSAKAESVQYVVSNYQGLSGSEGAVWRNCELNIESPSEDIITLGTHIYSRQGMGKVGLRNFMVREVGNTEAAVIGITAEPDMYESTEAEVNVSVKNVGISTIESYVVKLMTEDGEEIASKTINRSLEIGHNRDITLSFIPKHLGSYRVYATIQADGDQYDEDNHSSLVRISVHPKEGDRYVTIGHADGHKATNIVDFMRQQSRSQILYYSDEMNLKNNVYITGVVLAYTPSADAEFMDAIPVKVHVANTDESRLFDSAYGGTFIDVDSMTEVFGLDIALNGEDEQYNEVYIRFEQPFEYDCTKNLVVDIYKNNEEQYYNPSWYVDYSSGIPYRGIYWSAGYDYEMDPYHTSMNYVPYTKFSYIEKNSISKLQDREVSYKYDGDMILFSELCDEIQVYDITGLCVASATSTDRISLSGIGNGIYIISARMSQNYVVHKVVVE